MSVIWLFCEGKTDPPVLRAAFYALGISNITAEATGTSPAKVASWKREQGNAAASVSDRDYRPLAHCDATYLPGKKKFYWRRHSIENYLLEPVVVAKAFESLKQSMSEVKSPPSWVESLPSELDKVATDLQNAAKQISNQECGCIALQRLWSSLGDKFGHVQFSTPAIYKADDEQKEADCRQGLVDVAKQIAATAKSWSTAELLKTENVEEMYNEKLNEVSASAYLETNAFLYEFHGKRLKRSFLSLLNEQYGLALSGDLFQEELIKGFGIVLAEDAKAAVAKDIRDVVQVLQPVG